LKRLVTLTTVLCYRAACDADCIKQLMTMDIKGTKQGTVEEDLVEWCQRSFCLTKMLGIYGEGKPGQLTNPFLRRKWSLKWCVCVCLSSYQLKINV